MEFVYTLSEQNAHTFTHSGDRIAALRPGDWIAAFRYPHIYGYLCSLSISLSLASCTACPRISYSHVHCFELAGIFQRLDTMKPPEFDPGTLYILEPHFSQSVLDRAPNPHFAGELRRPKPALCGRPVCRCAAPETKRHAHCRCTA